MLYLVLCEYACVFLTPPQVELAGKHIIVNASERKMNVKFSRYAVTLPPFPRHVLVLHPSPPVSSHALVRSEGEAEKWQAALEAQIRRVAEESAHQGRVLVVSVCKLKAQVDRFVHAGHRSL